MPKPSWKLHSGAYASLWNLRAPSHPTEEDKQLAKVAINAFGLTGVDIKSHQSGPRRDPTETIAQCNDAQDKWCELARPLPRPADIRIPSSPPFAYLTVEGKMITSPPAHAAR